MDALLGILIVVVGLVAVGILAVGDPARVGVAGTLLGGVVGFLSAYLIERSRRRIDQSRRFEEQRRSAYVRLIEAGNEVEQVIRDRHIKVWAQRARPDLEHVIPPRPDFSKVAVLEAEVELLGKVGAYVGMILFTAALKMLDVAAEPTQTDDDAVWERRWNEASRAVIHERGAFIDAAKRDLDLPTGVMTKWQERRWRLRKRLRLAPRAKPKPSEPAE